MLLFYPSLITLIAVLSAAAGVWLTSFHGLSRRLVPFGGGVLLGVALFWVLPEMAEFFTWQVAILWLACGFLLLAAIDRFVYPGMPGLFSFAPARTMRHPAAWIRSASAGRGGAA